MCQWWRFYDVFSPKFFPKKSDELREQRVKNKKVAIISMRENTSGNKFWTPCNWQIEAQKKKWNQKKVFLFS